MLKFTVFVQQFICSTLIMITGNIFTTLVALYVDNYTSFQHVFSVMQFCSLTCFELVDFHSYFVDFYSYIVVDIY